MELHKAIKNILKYQGEEFLLDPKMINALTDFQAFEQYPALKNVFRMLHQDGYVEKIKNAGKWDMACDQMVYEIERDYAFPRDLVEFTLKSIGVGLGYACNLSQLSQPNQQTPKKNKQTSSSLTKPWSKLSTVEREAFLNSILEVQSSTCGLKYDSVYLADSGFDSFGFDINYEVKGILTKSASVNFTYAIYDHQNRLRKTYVMTSTFEGRKNKKCHIIDNHYVGFKCNYSELNKIVLFFDEFND